MYPSRRVIPLFVLLALVSGCKEKAPPAEQTEPRRKNKEEAFQVFDKHRDTYVRCEKLQRGAQPKTSTAETTPPPKAEVIEAQRCSIEYWKGMKRDIGPYDQAQIDEWYAEWRKGVKIE